MGPAPDRPAGLFAELGRWRDKATKRGKVTQFRSDIIDDWLNAEVMAAQGAVGPDAAFSFLKQVSLSVRMRAEREIKKKIQKILESYKRRAVQAARGGEEFDYAGMADKLRAAVLPELRSLVVDNALRLSVDTGISFDPAIINQEALRWANQYAGDLVQGLSNTTRKQIREATSAFIQTPGLTIGDVSSLLEPAFGEGRADMIASTEVTRSYAMATNRTQALIAQEVPELETAQVWNTMQDELVCFPKDTFVTTRDGRRHIQDVEPGEHVLTRAGYRLVLSASKRLYDGPLVRVRANQIVVTPTLNHPFWTEEHEWTKACDLKVGHTLLLSDGTAEKITRVSQSWYHSFIPILVYNLQVEDEPEFYANDILVHNCPICGPLEGAPKSQWQVISPSVSLDGPPAHPRCRCSSSIRFESPDQLATEFQARQDVRESFLREAGLWREPARPLSAIELDLQGQIESMRPIMESVIADGDPTGAGLKSVIDTMEQQLDQERKLNQSLWDSFKIPPSQASDFEWESLAAQLKDEGMELYEKYTKDGIRSGVAHARGAQATGYMVVGKEQVLVRQGAFSARAAQRMEGTIWKEAKGELRDAQGELLKRIGFTGDDIAQASYEQRTRLLEEVGQKGILKTGSGRVATIDRVPPEARERAVDLVDFDLAASAADSAIDPLALPTLDAYGKLELSDLIKATKITGGGF